MRKVIAAVMLSALPALADDYSSQSLYNQTHASSQSAANAKALGLGVGVGFGGAGVGVGHGGAAVGGSASLTYNEAPASQQRGTVTIKNTPDVTISNIAPSSDCMGVTTIGGSAAGFSAAGGTSWESKPCQLRETARVFHALGHKDDAIAVLCVSEYAASAPSCVAMKQQRAE